MFTQKKTLLHFVLALVVLATSLAWTPLDGQAKDGVGDPPAPPELSCAGAYGHKYADGQWYPGCGKGWKDWNGWVGWRPVPKPRISLAVHSDLLFVYGDRLRRLQTYTVRVRKGSGGWTGLRPIRSTWEGTATQTYRLPSSLKRSLRLYVCLKDTDSDRTYCGWAERIY
jgi:hypothetical protein